MLTNYATKLLVQISEETPGQGSERQQPRGKQAGSDPGDGIPASPAAEGAAGAEEAEGTAAAAAAAAAGPGPTAAATEGAAAAPAPASDPGSSVPPRASQVDMSTRAICLSLLLKIYILMFQTGSGSKESLIGKKLMTHVACPKGTVTPVSCCFLSTAL